MHRANTDRASGYRRISMHAVSISEHAEFLDRLGSTLPVEFARFDAADASGNTKPSRITLRFTYRDVPFVGSIERQGTVSQLRLTGHVGPLPFSARAARRRRRALTTLAAAGRTPLSWRVSVRQEIIIGGGIELPPRLTPSAMVAGAMQVLLAGDGYLALLLDVLGDTAELNSRQAA